MAKNQATAKTAKKVVAKRWRGDAERDLATYRLLGLGKALIQHTGQQEDIAEQIGRHSDLLAQLSEEGYSGLVPQAIIEPGSGEQLYYGRVEDSRDAYLMYCRTPDFEAAVGYAMDKIDRDIGAGEVHFFRGDAEIAIAWAGDLLRQVERGDFRRAGGASTNKSTSKIGAATDGDTERPVERDALANRRARGGAQESNRHRYKRSSVFCAGKLIFDDGQIECDILNISAGGAQIRLLSDLEPPERFILRIEGFGEFQAEVVRKIGDKFGVTFAEAPDAVERVVEDIINHPERTNEIREHPRRLVLLSGAAYVDNRPVECRILDISAGGARLRVDGEFEHESRFPLMIYRFGEFPVEVAWERDADVGIAFIDDADEIGRIIGHILPKKDDVDRRR